MLRVSWMLAVLQIFFSIALMRILAPAQVSGGALSCSWGSISAMPWASGLACCIVHQPYTILTGIGPFNPQMAAVYILIIFLLLLPVFEDWCRFSI